MASESKTTEKLGGSNVKQFAVFLQNKVGALLDIVKLLNDHNVLVLALSVEDSSDVAIVRIVVSDPDHVEELLSEQDIACAVADLVVVEMREGAAELGKLLSCLLMAEVNIHTTYSLLTRPRGHTALALHVEDDECACAVLRSHGFRVLSQQDISR
jgi:hypothetical protein